MERAGGAPLLLLVCLLSRAVLPGMAQEVVTSEGPHTQSPAAATVLPMVTAVDLRSTGTPGLPSMAPGGEESEEITATDSPVAITSQSSMGAPATTGVPQEGATDHTSTTTSLTSTNAETTGPNLTQPDPTTQPPIKSATEESTTGPPGSLTESTLPPSSLQPPTTQKPLTTGTPLDTTRPATQTSWISAITTVLLTTVPPTDPTTPARPHSTRAQEQRGPPVLKVGEKEGPGFPGGNSSNPIFVMIVSVFTITVVMVVLVVGFRRYKKRNRRTEFRRLQDLPMDDMMEDTPLSLYSY